MLVLLLIGWESGASFVSQSQSVKSTYQSSKQIIICSHILWDKWRACLQTNASLGKTHVGNSNGFDFILIGWENGPRFLSKA